MENVVQHLPVQALFVTVTVSREQRCAVDKTGSLFFHFVINALIPFSSSASSSYHSCSLLHLQLLTPSFSYFLLFSQYFTPHSYFSLTGFCPSVSRFSPPRPSSSMLSFSHSFHYFIYFFLFHPLIPSSPSLFCFISPGSEPEGCKECGTTTKNLQNIKDQYADQPAKKRA
jgi:hypothetical protein